MTRGKPSPAERFRDELGHRLSVDAHLCLPSANILVGVMIDAMDALEQRSAGLNLITLRNVLSVSDEILALGRILGVPHPESYVSQEPENIPHSTLQDLQILCLPRTCLDTPSCPITVLNRSTVLRTYLSIARLLASYMGPQGVQELVKDFNRPTTNFPDEGYTRRVPGVGPRTVRLRRERERRRMDSKIFERPEEEKSDWTPPPYQRNARGWPISTSLNNMERDRHAFVDRPERIAGYPKDEARTSGWRSLRLKFKRFSS